MVFSWAATSRGERWYEGDDGVRRKVDIVVHAWGSTYMLNVAVVDPAVPTYIRMGAAARPDVAARHCGEQKIACWREMRGVRGVSFGCAIRRGGHRATGPTCLRFFHDNLEEVDWVTFYQRMNASIARWNARMVLTCKGGNRSAEVRSGSIGSRGWYSYKHKHCA